MARSGLEAMCLAMVTCLALACPSDDTGSSQESTGAESTAGSTTLIEPAGSSSSSGSEASSTGSSGSSSSSTSGASSSSSSTGEPAPVGPLVCQRECELPSSCCGVNEDGCPSVNYPGNYACVDGACVPPACRSDAECEGAFPGTTCHRVFGEPQCVRLCDEDPTVCEDDEAVCIAQTDDGQSFCRASCGEGGTVTCFTTACDEATGLCICEPGDCPTGETCAPL